MRNLFGIAFPRSSNEEHNHAVRYILGFVCVLLLLIFVYYLVLQPIIAKLYLGPEIYEGVHLVQSNEYLAFDGGEDFSEVLETCGAFELGDLTEFFYFDNRRSDSLFYGKQCDVYALSVKVASDALYEEKKESVYTEHLRSHADRYFCVL